MTDETRIPFENDWRNMLYVEMKTTGGDPSHFFEILESIIKTRAWETLTDDEGKPVGSLQRLIEAPLPVGCGQSIEKVLKLLKLEHRYEEVGEYKDRMDWLRNAVEDELPAVNEHGTNQYDTALSGGRNPTSTKQGGNNIDRGAYYDLGRLKRDHPDLAKRVIEGEMSSNAAAVEAGIRSHRVSINIDNLDSAVATLRKKLDPGELYELGVKLIEASRGEEGEFPQSE